MPDLKSCSLKIVRIKSCLGGGGVKVEHRSPAELDALVKKMLEPAKKYFIPPPPSQRPPEYTPSGLRDTTGFVVLNDMPNRLLPCSESFFLYPDSLNCNSFTFSLMKHNILNVKLYKSTWVQVLFF